MFAGIDRADRVYAGLSPNQQRAKKTLQTQRTELLNRRDQSQRDLKKKVDEKAAKIDPRIKELTQKASQFPPPSQHGFHSTIATRADMTKWVQVDLGTARTLDRIELIACYDDFNNIGSGFGFPVRFKVEASAGEDFAADNVRTLIDATDRDFINPESSPLKIKCDDLPVRMIRVTATKLAERRNDFILALGELRAITTEAETEQEANIARDATVSASDHIPPNARWAPQFLVDDAYHRVSLDDSERAELNRLREQRPSDR